MNVFELLSVICFYFALTVKVIATGFHGDVLLNKNLPIYIVQRDGLILLPFKDAPGLFM